jgi:hypothetical protein
MTAGMQKEHIAVGHRGIFLYFVETRPTILLFAFRLAFVSRDVVTSGHPIEWCHCGS